MQSISHLGAFHRWDDVKNQNDKKFKNIGPKWKLWKLEDQIAKIRPRDKKKVFLSKKVKNYMEKHILPGSKQLRKIGDAHH